MKVGFSNVKFGQWEPKNEVEYNGRKFRIAEVPVLFDDGCRLTYRIAERSLETEMGKVYGDIGNINCDLDDSISFYADDEELMYSILEQCCEDEKVEFTETLDNTE